MKTISMWYSEDLSHQFMMFTLLPIVASYKNWPDGNLANIDKIPTSKHTVLTKVLVVNVYITKENQKNSQQVFLHCVPKTEEVFMYCQKLTSTLTGIKYIFPPDYNKEIMKT